MSLILGHSLGVREKILATPSVGVGGETRGLRRKRTDLARSKKPYLSTKKVCWVFWEFRSEQTQI